MLCSFLVRGLHAKEKRDITILKKRETRKKDFKSNFRNNTPLLAGREHSDYVDSFDTKEACKRFKERSRGSA